jgi:hypothetical protein
MSDTIEATMYTTATLARRLSVSPKFIEKNRRRLPAVRCGRCWRYDCATVERRLLSGVLLSGKK